MKFKSLIQSINWSEDLWSAPNLLTLSRLLFLPFIIYFISWRTTTGTWIAFILLLLMTVTDILDGFLARRLHEKSNLGRFIDPVIDKICVDSIIVVLAFVTDLPLWYMVLLLVRDVMLIIGGIYLVLKQQIMFESNLPGKLSFGANVLIIITFLFSIDALKSIIIWLAAAIIVISTINYFITPYADVLGIRRYFKTRTFHINVNKNSNIDVLDTR